MNTTEFVRLSKKEKRTKKAHKRNVVKAYKAGANNFLKQFDLFYEQNERIIDALQYEHTNILELVYVYEFDYQLRMRLDKLYVTIMVMVIEYLVILYKEIGMLCPAYNLVVMERTYKKRHYTKFVVPLREQAATIGRLLAKKIRELKPGSLDLTSEFNHCIFGDPLVFFITVNLGDFPLVGELFRSLIAADPEFNWMQKFFLQNTYVTILYQAVSTYGYHPHNYIVPCLFEYIDELYQCNDVSLLSVHEWSLSLDASNSSSSSVLRFLGNEDWIREVTEYTKVERPPSFYFNDVRIFSCGRSEISVLDFLILHHYPLNMIEKFVSWGARSNWKNPHQYSWLYTTIQELLETDKSMYSSEELRELFEWMHSHPELF